MAENFLGKTYEKLTFALRSADALKQIQDRDRKLAGGYAPAAKDEPIATRRKIA
jgi:hypothetical protein